MAAYLSCSIGVGGKFPSEAVPLEVTGAVSLHLLSRQNGEECEECNHASVRSHDVLRHTATRARERP